MQKKVFGMLLGFLLFAAVSNGQELANVAKTRNRQTHDLLDYRFRGGFYTFERMFLQTVKYTDMARENCIIGIVVLSFQVDCDGNLKDVKIKNALHFGLDQEIQKFMESTNGHWNKCRDNKYTRFSVPIQFTMEGTKTDTLDPVITLVGKNPGYVCNSDSYYYQKAKEALAKKKGKKARTYIEILIRRNPFNDEYYDMMKKAMALSGKKKKKK
ncbi:energy transducer TonB [Candidatus Sulfidibacterium hydrothermale]|uniref:energy transducer TonB n=1 Tax=Candidatus Sulfidibacterium hydrothermale TaxID=2875962 RepID=UPI001F0A2808|nr:energy transducer TonB [Candidatus Sulfidibacterium hydrothermale]UBM62565.1 energy transducer TonB [Candidatus Sulfidibacterium hydrothermale]